MTARLKVALLGALFAASIQSLPAADDACLNRTIALNVQTEDFRPVTGLASSNFRGKIHGKLIQIVSVSYDIVSPRIVILLDASGSMEKEWAFELTLARELVSSAPAKTAFSVMTFSTQLEDTYSFTDSPSIVVQELGGLWPGKLGGRRTPYGKTALLDSILAAVNLLRPTAPGDAIFLVSDGGENASKSREKDVKDALLNSGARLFTFIAAEPLPSRGRTIEESMGPGKLRGWILAGGGDVFTYPPIQGADLSVMGPTEFQMKVRDSKIAPLVARAMAQEMSEFYSLQIKLPEDLNKPRDLDLEVVDSDGNKHAHWRVIYPHKLAVCP